MKERSRVEQFERIRRDSREEGLSIRALARRHGVHRRTVRQALADAVPPARRTPERSGAGARAVCGCLCGGWLMADLDGAAQAAAYRPAGVAAAGRGGRGRGGRVDGARIWWPGFGWRSGWSRAGDGAADASGRRGGGGRLRRVRAPSIAGMVIKLWMFVLRLSHSGKAVHIAYAQPGPGVVPGRAREGVRGASVGCRSG